MPRMSKSKKLEWSFFLNDRGRKAYNTLCRRCVHDCKQSFRTVVVICPHYMKTLMRPDLLILDDLGAERNTSFGKERVFDVVDKRLLTGKPMIVTTNIPLSVMKQATDLDDRRIFDRILEVCVPIMFDGDSFRKSTAADNLKTAARLLG